MNSLFTASLCEHQNKVFHWARFCGGYTFAFFMIWDPIRSQSHLYYLWSQYHMICVCHPAASRMLNRLTSNDGFLFELVSWCTGPSPCLKASLFPGKCSCARTGCARSSPNTTCDSVGLRAKPTMLKISEWLHIAVCKRTNSCEVLFD